MSSTAAHPILTLQDHVADLLAADPYFQGVTIYTERIADLEQQIADAIARLGFFLTITTSAGRAERSGPAGAHMRMVETLTVAITSNPLLDAASHPTALDAVPEVIRILDGQPNQPGVDTVHNPNAGTILRVTGHEFVPEAPEGLSVQHVNLETTIHFLS